MTRTPLPPRRDNVSLDLEFVSATGAAIALSVTYGVDDVTGRVTEVFCTTPKTGTDMAGTINDACITISRLLQFGDNIHDIAAALGENRAEGADHGTPASPLGVIARAGTVIEPKPGKKLTLAHGRDGDAAR